MVLKNGIPSFLYCSIQIRIALPYAHLRVSDRLLVPGRKSGSRSKIHGDFIRIAHIKPASLSCHLATNRNNTGDRCKGHAFPVDFLGIFHCTTGIIRIAQLPFKDRSIPRNQQSVVTE